MAEGKALFDAIDVGRVDQSGAGKGTTALGIFGLQQMPLAGAGAQHFSAGGNFKTFRRRFFGLNAFWTSHD